MYHHHRGMHGEKQSPRSSLVRITPPTVEPLTISEVVVHLGLDATNFEPAPSVPTAVLGNGAGNVDNGAHRYRLTFVTASGETDGGAISAIVTVIDRAVNGLIALSNLAIGGSSVTARKLYRTKAGQDSFFLVATIGDNSTTIFTDNVSDASLGVGIPLTNSTSDPELLRLVRVARTMAENYLCKAIMRQKWRLTLDFFPDEDYIELRPPPLLSVESVTYIDSGTELQLMDTDLYEVDAAAYPPRLYLAYNRLWPITLINKRNAVTIDFWCGYGVDVSAVPETYRAGLLLLLTDLHENREILIESRYVEEMTAIERCFADRFIEFR